MQKSNFISFKDSLIIKELKKKKDRSLRVLVKKLPKSEDHSESHQNSKSVLSEETHSW